MWGSKMSREPGGKWESFWEAFALIVPILGVILYIVFLVIGKPKDCQNAGFTFDSVTVVKTINHVD